MDPLPDGAKKAAAKKPKEPKAPKPAKEPKEKKPPSKRSSGGGGSSSKRAKADDADGRATPGVEDEDDVLVTRPDPSEGAQIVVIHPGSTNVRIGLASAAAPRILPQCVAYRRSEQAAPADAPAKYGGSGGVVAQAEATARQLEPSLAPLARQLRLGVRLVGQEHPPVALTVQEVDGARGAGASTASTGGARMLVGEAALEAASSHPDEWSLIYPMAWGGRNQMSGMSERATCVTARAARALLSRQAIAHASAVTHSGRRPVAPPEACASPRVKRVFSAAAPPRGCRPFVRRLTHASRERRQVERPRGHLAVRPLRRRRRGWPRSAYGRSRVCLCGPRPPRHV